MQSSYRDVKNYFEFDVAGYNVVSTLPLQHQWYDMNWIFHPKLRKRLVQRSYLTSYYQLCKDVFNFMPWFERCTNIFITIFRAHRELKLLPKVEATLEQCCHSDILISTSRQHCVSVAQFCKLTATPWHYHCVAATLLFLLSILWSSFIIFYFLIIYYLAKYENRIYSSSKYGVSWISDAFT